MKLENQMIDFAEHYHVALHNISALNRVERQIARELPKHAIGSTGRNDLLHVLRAAHQDRQNLLRQIDTLRRHLLQELQNQTKPASLREPTEQEILALLNGADDKWRAENEARNAAEMERESRIMKRKNEFYALGNVQPLPKDFHDPRQWRC